jgi:hypothetical protein
MRIFEPGTEPIDLDQLSTASLLYLGDAGRAEGLPYLLAKAAVNEGRCL